MIFAITGVVGVLAFVGLRLRASTQSWSEAHACYVVDEVATVIDDPGDYCLVDDVVLPTGSIEITSPNVTLDLHGHTIRRGERRAVDRPAIKVGKVGNVQIRNGSIDDVHIGVQASFTRELMIEDMHFSDIGYAAAIIAEGEKVSLLNNRIDRVGYGPDATMPDGTGAYAIGFNLNSRDVLIRGNRFHGIGRQPVSKAVVGEGVAVIVGGGSREVRIYDNEINLSPEEFPGSIGIWLAVGTSSSVRGNDLRNLERGIAGREATAHIESNRVRMDRDLASASSYGIFLVYADMRSRIADNVVSGYAQPVTGTGRDGKTPLDMPNNSIQ